MFNDRFVSIRTLRNDVHWESDMRNWIIDFRAARETSNDSHAAHCEYGISIWSLFAYRFLTFVLKPYLWLKYWSWKFYFSFVSDDMENPPQQTPSYRQWLPHTLERNLCCLNVDFYQWGRIYASGITAATVDSLADFLHPTPFPAPFKLTPLSSRYYCLPHTHSDARLLSKI